MSKYLRGIREALTDLDVTDVDIETSGKHIKIWGTYNGNKLPLVVASKTPGDYRANSNLLARFRRNVQRIAA